MASLLALMASMPLSAQEAAKTTGKSLPGLQINGEVRLPNGWTLKPAGKQIPLGDFPVNIAMHPTGKYLAVLHAGYGTHEIIVLETDKAGANITSRTTLKQTFAGICFAPDGKKLYASAAEHASA
ncbi:MAG: YncE family protein, partial [Planctomycetia bacterium]